MTQSQSATATVPVPSNKRAGNAEAYTFRAPRWSDLTQCPVCGTTPDDFGACDYCGSEGHAFKETYYDA